MVVFATTFALGLGFSLRLLNPADESWFVQVIARMRAGDVLYRDIAYGAGPLPAYATAGLDVPHRRRRPRGQAGRGACVRRHRDDRLADRRGARARSDRQRSRPARTRLRGAAGAAASVRAAGRRVPPTDPPVRPSSSLRRHPTAITREPCGRCGGGARVRLETECGCLCARRADGDVPRGAALAQLPPTRWGRSELSGASCSASSGSPAPLVATPITASREKERMSTRRQHSRARRMVCCWP